MPMIQRFLKDTYQVLTYLNTVEPNDIGEMPAPSISNLGVKSVVLGRINGADTLEPDVLSPLKDVSVDVTTFVYGHFNIPDNGTTIDEGDYIRNAFDATEFYIVQFSDKKPGGTNGHHYEVRMQTSSISRIP
jgi:hypothetical protein